MDKDKIVDSYTIHGVPENDICKYWYEKGKEEEHRKIRSLITEHWGEKDIDINKLIEIINDKTLQNN